MTRRPAGSPTRDGLMRDLALGGAMGIWLWLVVGAFHLLPDSLATTAGLGGMMVVAAAAAATRLRPYIWYVVGGWTVLAAVVALTPLSQAISAGWVRDDRPVVGSIEAVVVLSGGVTADTTLTSESLDRLLAGIDLLRGATLAGDPSLITTLDERRVGPRGVTSEPDQSRIVRLAGLEGRRIATEATGSTRQEAEESCRALGGCMDSVTGEALGRRVVVVTSPMHTRRACATFEAVGFEVSCVPARMRARTGRVAAHPRDRLVVFGQLVYELLGLAKYRVMGWHHRRG